MITHKTKYEIKEFNNAMNELIWMTARANMYKEVHPHFDFDLTLVVGEEETFFIEAIFYADKNKANNTTTGN